jgi:hypothetical protein
MITDLSLIDPSAHASEELLYLEAKDQEGQQVQGGVTKQSCTHIRGMYAYCKEVCWTFLSSISRSSLRA